MPPKCTRVKNSKTLKENVCVKVTSKSKIVQKSSTAPRKALADKTNSASDDNVSLTSPKFVNYTRKTSCPATQVSYKTEEHNIVQTRRKRKLPERFVDNHVLINLNKSVNLGENDNRNTNETNPLVLLNPLQKSQEKLLEKSIADCRPKRICRLPSKFEDHSISPSKYVPVQPIQASTPIAQIKGSKNVSKKNNTVKEKVVGKRNLRRVQTAGTNKKNLIQTILIDTKNEDTSIKKLQTRKAQPVTSSHPKRGFQKKPKDHTETIVVQKNKADTNNNANVLNQDKNLYDKPPSFTNKNRKVKKGNRFIEKEYSFKVFDNNKKANKRDASNLDVYEFTYDPTEEPPPQKKKHRRIVRKKQDKKRPVFTNNYNKNVAKSLAILKNVLSSKTKVKIQPETALKQKQCTDPAKSNEISEKNKIQTVEQGLNCNTEHQVMNKEQNITQKNYNSFHVEDIIVNHESVCNENNDINYSPVNSPIVDRFPSEPRNEISHFEEIRKSNDPLNLQDDLSFFDENPAASSSMNVSTRNPLATPWRVEFGQLPIKWQANTYVKPNMTPAFESSFIIHGDKKKHVYTNIVPDEENTALPEIVENDHTSKLKQTSIISFIKEVAEKSANKKSKLKSTPVKGNTIFEDISNISSNDNVTPKKQIAMGVVRESVTPSKNKSLENVTSSTDNMSISDKENSAERHKKRDKNITYFGFDESEEQDQENISPRKKFDKQRKRALRPRSRAILQELNVQKRQSGIPKFIDENSKKNKKMNINHMLNDAGTESVPEKTDDCNSETGNDINNAVISDSANIGQEDSQSVHLFEDLEVVHHVKPPRKSYVKQKRVAFRQNSVSSDSQDSDIIDNNASSAEEDDLQDLTFNIPMMKPKKTKRKKKSKKLLSKKEEKEVEAWAAGFNSMCEDIDEFDLVVE